MSTLPTEIIDKIYIYYWRNIYINNVLSELKNIINTSIDLSNFYNNIINNYDIDVDETHFNKIIYYNNFIKKYCYTNKFTLYKYYNNNLHKYSSSVFKILIKSDCSPKYIKFLSDMYCDDLVYFSIYCINNSGYMRFYMQNRLTKINEQFIYYKIKLNNLRL